MIKKIIASDLDGTLLPYGQTEIDPEAFNVIEDLQKKDVVFVPASGRNIHSIRKLFLPLHEKLSYLSENGAVVWHENQEISDIPLPAHLIDDVSEYIYKDPDLDLYLTSAVNGYVVSDDPERQKIIKERFGEYAHIVDSWDDLFDRIVKICAITHEPQGAAEAFKRLKERFGDEIITAMAGPDVVNFALGSKGHGLEILTQYLGKKPEDVIAFGDNYNDFPMLKFAGESYMMRTDDPERIKAADHMCDNVVDELKKIYARL